MSIKSAWQRSVLCIRTFPGTFCIFKKSAWQKVSFTSALPQALNISSAVSSTVTVTSLEKKCLGKKSAWDAASQHPAYYAGLLSGSLSGSLWLTLALSGSLWLTLALSGSLWLAVRLSLAHSYSFWLSLAHSGSFWLTLALSGSLWLTLALSGPL